ncbi:MAG: TerB family tellurite resistance protein [Prevotella sp.]|nr:TerB family tellurite resistance protein [Prevotella sp.]
MEKIIEVVRLMAKTGLFFASADGIYQQRERQFINDFVSGIEQIGSITPELKGEVYGALNNQYKIEEIIRETNAVLEGFNKDERRAILASIRGFITKVIEADGSVHPLERENFRLWKDQFGHSA